MGLSRGRVPGAAPLLLLIDLQLAIRDPRWGVRNNPNAEANIGALLDHWRARSWPVIHVRHDSTEPGSSYRPGQSGNQFIPGLGPAGDETIVPKRTNNAFIGTRLEALLEEAGEPQIFVAGVITENSVEATVRMAGNLGFEVMLVEDACFTFGRADWRGVLRSADDIHALSLSTLHGEYCTVVTTVEALRSAATPTQQEH